MTLTPPAHFVGIFPDHGQHIDEVALKLQEKKAVLDRSNFNVEDASSGALAFLVDEHGTRHKGHKGMSDSRGRILFNIVRKPLRIHSTFEGRAPTTDDVLFTVKASFGIGTRSTVTYINQATGKSEKLRLRGNWSDHTAEITLEDGQTVARVSRQFHNQEGFTSGKQMYILSVAPNVDAALMSAICVCLDERAHES
jgi:uncharacterized protein YxjI